MTRVEKPKATAKISLNYGISLPINNYEQLFSGIVLLLSYCSKRKPLIVVLLQTNVKRTY
jgi:hypothetical protein